MMMRRCWVRIIPALWLSAAIASQLPQPASGGLRLLAEGFESLEARRLPQAAHALTSAREAVPELRDYASYFLAQAHFRAKDYAEASEAAEQVVAFQPISPLAGRAAVLGARAWLEQEQPRKALALLARVDEDSLPAPEARLVRARALEAAGSPLDAVADFQKVCFLYPESPEAKEAYEGLGRLRSALAAAYPEPSADLRLERAGRLRDAGEIADARKEYDSIEADFAGTPRDLARLRIAALPYFAGEGATALARLGSLGRQAGEVEAERLYYLVQCYRRLERDDEMSATLDELASAAPGSPWRLKALNAGSSRFLVKDDPRQQTVFTACAESFPDAPEAGMCNWHAAWWAYRHRDSSAAQLLRQHLKLYPGSEKSGAAVFYLGRLAAKSGDGAAALTWYRFLSRRYPNYYYTYAARADLRALDARHLQPSQQVEEFLASVQFPGRPVKADFTPDAATSKRIERARLLSRADLDTWAESELRFAARNGARPWPVVLELAEMATRDGAPDRALRHIKSVMPTYLFVPRDGAPEHFWRLAFPMPYRSLVVKYSTQAGLDPFLVAALIRQESEFNPKALSVSKAVGLMQIMPAVGRELARKVPVRGFRASQLTRPEINIRLGTYYFRRLLDSCDGRMEDALAAYNAGQSRVVLWRGWGPFEETTEFAETIPFTQTRDYVQIILRNAEVYRWLYASEPQAPEAAVASNAHSQGAVAPTRSSARTPSKGAVEVAEKRAASDSSVSKTPAKRSAQTPNKKKRGKAASAAARKPSKRGPKASKKVPQKTDEEPSEESGRPISKSPKAKKKHSTRPVS